MSTPGKKTRCAWVTADQAYIEYHDEEWGVPVRDDRTQFEFLILEGAQAGLSWATVLNKRAVYRKAFAQFDPEKVARFSDRKIARLLDDPGIIRNRLKVNAAVSNARAFLDVRQEFDGFCNYIWSFVGNSPIQNRWKRMDQVPATSKESDALARDLRQRGFKFVGSTIVYAHMQATGMVNDHVTDCFRHSECRDLA